MNENNTENETIEEVIARIRRKLAILENKLVPEDTSIDDMELSVRTYCCLEREGLTTIKEIIKYSETDLLRIRNFGSSSLKELKIKLHGWNYYLLNEQQPISQTEKIQDSAGVNSPSESNESDTLMGELEDTKAENNELKSQIKVLQTCLVELQNENTELKKTNDKLIEQHKEDLQSLKKLCSRLQSHHTKPISQPMQKIKFSKAKHKKTI